eukprot:6489683-Amphidinium_carterae.1
MDSNNRIKYDTCCKIIRQSDVEMWSEVVTHPIKGGRKFQSVTDDDIKIHGFKRCDIMSGGIGLRVNFIICDVSCPTSVMSIVQYVATQL